MGREAVVDMETLWGGTYATTNASEDFAYISEQVPSAILWLAAGSPEKGYSWPSHNPKTDFDDSVLYVGTAAYAAVATAWLEMH